MKTFSRPLTRHAATGLVAALLLGSAATGATTASAQMSSSSFPALSSSSSGSSGSSGSGGSEDVTATPQTPWAESISEGLDVELVGDILGRDISEHVGFLSGDLGIMEYLGTGEEFAIVFGDSFRGERFGQGEWLSPVGVVAQLDQDGKIEILRPLNDDDEVEQLVDYRHNDRGLTLIPSDIINLDGTLYMQGMWNEGIGNVKGTGIWRSTDDGATWRQVSTQSTDYLQGMGQLITWEEGPDGYVYIMTTSFQRNDPVYLGRVRPNDIADHSEWEYYSVNDSGSVVWSDTASPILEDNVMAGEMSLRYIDGHWVLAMFNRERMSIEVRVSEEIVRDWDEITPADVIVAGHGGWGQAQGPENFTQLYGAYIVPGSTIDDLDLVVSQWNTSNDSRYMSTQFNVQGLDEFFGIEAEASTAAPQARTLQAPATATEDQSVLEVTETDVDAETEQKISEEKLMEEAGDLAIVPLEDAAGTE